MNDKRLALCLLLVEVTLVGCVSSNGGPQNLMPAAENSVWKFPFEGSASSPVLDGGVLYVGSGDGQVNAIEASVDTQNRP